MDAYIVVPIIPDNSLHNPFPHSLLGTRQSSSSRLPSNEAALDDPSASLLKQSSAARTALRCRAHNVMFGYILSDGLIMHHFCTCFLVYIIQCIYYTLHIHVLRTWHASSEECRSCSSPTEPATMVGAQSLQSSHICFQVLKSGV